MADRAEAPLASQPRIAGGEAAALVAWLVIEPIGDLAPGDPQATTRAWFDELRLAAPLAGGLRTIGLDEGEAWAASDVVRMLLHLPTRSDIRGPAGGRDARLVERWLADDAIRTAIGVNTWEGAQYIDRDRFAATLRWAARLDELRGHVTGDPAFVARLSSAAEAAGYRVDRLTESLAGPARAKAPSARPKRARAIEPAAAGTGADAPPAKAAKTVAPRPGKPRRPPKG
jgi:hypothetical protein